MKNVVSLQLNAFPPNMECSEVFVFKNFINSQLLKLIFLSPNRCETNFKIYFFCRSVLLPCAVQLFLLPFSSHCSTQNIVFNDSGCIIKPPRPSSVFYVAPPFIGHHHNAKKLQCFAFSYFHNCSNLNFMSN